jgi:hypothetical protein
MANRLGVPNNSRVIKYMENPTEYSLDVYLNLEEKFKQINNFIDRNVKLYLIYKKLSLIYQGLNDIEYVLMYQQRAETALLNLPEGEDKIKLQEVDINKVHFSYWVNG